MARLAFITNEYPSEVQSGGGLAAYLARITKLVSACGHAVEVFTYSTQPAGTIEHEGVLVHRVPLPERSPNVLIELGARLPLLLGTRRTAARLRLAYGLARAFHAREREVQFAGVQSSNFNLTGFFVERRVGRPHVVRCSQSTRDCAFADRSRTLLDDRLTEYLELDYLRRADAVYAPSLRTVNVYSRFGVRMTCVRPPLSTDMSERAPERSLPERYLLHFGKFSRLKGTDLVARALRRAWETEPAIRLVLAGTTSPERYFTRFARGLDARVMYLGPLMKPQLNYVIRRAAATLAPSRVDNLPNTVIESLTLGTRVIGTRGASIDELVEDGESGQLIALGDAEALAEAMVQAHRGAGAWDRPFVRPRALDDMDPNVATRNLLRLFKLP